MIINKYEVSKNEFITSLYIYCNRRKREVSSLECLGCISHIKIDVQNREIHCNDDSEPF
jgi:hypothetical protein